MKPTSTINESLLPKTIITYTEKQNRLALSSFTWYLATIGTKLTSLFNSVKFICCNSQKTPWYCRVDLGTPSNDRNTIPKEKHRCRILERLPCYGNRQYRVLMADIWGLWCWVGGVLRPPSPHSLLVSRYGTSELWFKPQPLIWPTCTMSIGRWNCSGWSILVRTLKNRGLCKRSNLRYF